jgi:hypothetical protein
MTFDELKEILGELWFEESGDVILESENNHFVCISFRFPEGKVERILWGIDW